MRLSMLSRIYLLFILLVCPSLAFAQTQSAVGQYGNIIVNTNPNTAQIWGTVGIGTSSARYSSTLDVNGLGNVNALAINGNPAPLPLGGRLTLSSNTPVMTSDVTAATTIYYADYTSDLVPLYNGTTWSEYALGGQISLALDSASGHTGYQQSGNIFDLFLYNNSGTSA